jgi:protein-S-isoprenylcysteine O-methyltransferase Ste14
MGAWSPNEAVVTAGTIQLRVQPIYAPPSTAGNRLGIAAETRLCGSTTVCLDAEGKAMTENKFSTAQLAKMIIIRFVGGFIVLAAMFFLPAGTLDYWEAWVYIAVLFVPIVFVLSYLIRHDPALLERRMRMQEREAEQKLIVKLSFAWFFVMFLLPGFDRRFEWSNVPVALVIAADVLVVLGYTVVFLVFRENTYTSRVVEVERDQKVISSGPYAIVRHPMYVGVLIMYLLTPLALGSYWGVIPALLMVPMLIARIQNEEQVLGKELPGYLDYVQKVRYRLIPGVW